MKGKIHRATVTQADLHDVGSVDLMDAVAEPVPGAAGQRRGDGMSSGGSSVPTA